MQVFVQDVFASVHAAVLLETVVAFAVVVKAALLPGLEQQAGVVVEVWQATGCAGVKLATSAATSVVLLSTAALLPSGVQTFVQLAGLQLGEGWQLCAESWVIAKLKKKNKVIPTFFIVVEHLMVNKRKSNQHHKGRAPQRSMLSPRC